MAAEITVRPPVPAEAAAIWRVRVSTWRHAYAGILPAAFLDGLDPVDPDGIARVRRGIEQPPAGGRTLVAVRGRAVVGFSFLGPVREHRGAAPAPPGERGELYAIYVLPEEQGSGIGRRLLERSVAVLREDGCRTAALWVLEANLGARGFYEHLGWRPTGRRQLFEVGAVPEIEYRLDLTDTVSPRARVRSDSGGD